MLMPCRSVPPLPPTSWWAQIESRSPSGNWFANIVIFHSGKKSATTNNTPAPSTAYRARGESTWPSQLTSVMSVSAVRGDRGAGTRLDQEVPLHLLMHRRAEVRAVERIHAGLGRAERNRLGLSRIHDHVDVVTRDPEAVQHVALLLGVGHVQNDRVALLHLDLVGREIGAD